MPDLIILLSTYNGEKYLKEQLDSIIAQTYLPWELYVRDDASTDNTPALIKQYCEKDARIKLVSIGTENIGPKESFSLLIKQALNSNAKYFAFCDQDDVWLPIKLNEQLVKMQQLESKYGHDTPLLVHSDLTVVDETLKTMHSSFIEFLNFKVNSDNPLAVVLFKNIVTGCSILLNKPLMLLSFPIPKQAKLHDHWIALVAAGCGKLYCIKESLVLYRQHANNVIGSGRKKRKLFKLISGLLNPIRFIRKKNKKIKQIVSRAKSLTSLNKNFNKNNRQYINNWMTILQQTRINRIKTFYQNKPKILCFDIIMGLLIAKKEKICNVL